MINICLKWWGRTNRDLHWEDFVNWNCLFPGLSEQSMSSWWQKMSCVKGTPLQRAFFNKCFSCLVASHPSDNRQQRMTRKKTGPQYPGCYLSKTFDPLCSSWIFNLQVCLHQRNSSPTKILISKLDWKSSQHQMTKNMLDIRYEKWVAPFFSFRLDTFRASNHANKLHFKIKKIIIIVTILIEKILHSLSFSWNSIDVHWPLAKPATALKLVLVSIKGNGIWELPLNTACANRNGESD